MTQLTTRNAVRIVCVLVAGLLGILIGPTQANAHAGDESYLYLDVADDDLRGQVEMPYGDIRTVFGLELEGSEDQIVAELNANVDILTAYADEHLSIGDESGDWVTGFDGVLTLAQAYDGAGGEYAVLPFVVDLEGAQVPQVLAVSFDPFLEEIPTRNALLLIANDWQRGVFDNEAESLVRFDTDNRSAVVDLGDSSQWQNFSESIELGVDHIKTGPDHIFFVLVLLLPSVLVYMAGRWFPEPSFGASLWRVTKIVTMFTVAHSITFTLAGLGVLPLPPSRFIESVIAASIAAAALHNLRPIAANKEWVIAFVFGLFHGMGFASLVSELEVSQTTQLVSLLGRNVGIEIGQTVVVFMVFPGLFLLRRTVFYRPFFVAGSIGLAVVSLGWMLERIFELDVRASSVADRLVQFPRAIGIVLVFDLACAAIYWWQRSRDALLPVYGATNDDDDAPSQDRELETVS